jgi:ATP-dependent helicase HrpA
VVRYLRGIGRRLDKLGGDQARDAAQMAIVRRLTAEYDAARRDRPHGKAGDLAAIRWQLEELRVSLFAQVLGTSGPVSEKRIGAALDALAGR